MAQETCVGCRKPIAVTHKFCHWCGTKNEAFDLAAYRSVWKQSLEEGDADYHSLAEDWYNSVQGMDDPSGPEDIRVGHIVRNDFAKGIYCPNCGSRLPPLD